jgi:hypothetical protein
MSPLHEAVNSARITAVLSKCLLKQGSKSAAQRYCSNTLTAGMLADLAWSRLTIERSNQLVFVLRDAGRWRSKDD